MRSRPRESVFLIERSETKHLQASSLLAFLKLMYSVLEMSRIDTQEKTLRNKELEEEKCRHLENKGSVATSTKGSRRARKPTLPVTMDKLNPKIPVDKTNEAAVLLDLDIANEVPLPSPPNDDDDTLEALVRRAQKLGYAPEHVYANLAKLKASTSEYEKSELTTGTSFMQVMEWRGPNAELLKDEG
ncbi:hypothetical protein ONZ45_g9659 [Pleurotus djamor]|nr:hypothetical protein ONZ45_g9659 [Pleurotus djamor]